MIRISEFAPRKSGRRRMPPMTASRRSDQKRSASRIDTSDISCASCTGMLRETDSTAGFHSPKAKWGRIKGESAGVLDGVWMYVGRPRGISRGPGGRPHAQTWRDSKLRHPYSSLARRSRKNVCVSSRASDASYILLSSVQRPCPRRPQRSVEHLRVHLQGRIDVRMPHTLRDQLAGQAFVLTGDFPPLSLA